MTHGHGVVRMSKAESVAVVSLREMRKSALRTP